MSTAIALQNMGSSPSRGTHTMRHRTVSKTDINSDELSVKEDPWLKEPNDNESSKLPLESHTLKPTTIYWLSPHGLLTKRITVFDLTKDMDVPYSGMTNEYKAAVKRTLKDHSFTPAMTCHRSSWLGLKNNITDGQDNHLAHWSHPWHSGGEAVLTFPEGSTVSGHPISLHNKRWGFRAETFTLNSQPYVWEMDSIWHSTDMTLYRLMGSGDTQKKVEVGKYAQKSWGSFVTGGTFVVDEKELNGYVACLTLIHSRKVYSRQMIEHTVEQIDALYWSSGTHAIDDDTDADTDVTDDMNTLYHGDDLSIDEHIAKLPTQWDTSSDVTPSRNVTQDDYLASVSRLQDLSARRQTLQNKLNTYRTLLSLLEPYRAPKDNIQPNLVWKEAPLAPELVKMRTLAIRVAGRVEERFGDVQVPATAEDDEEVDMEGLRDEGKRKVDKVLDSW
ncbi:kinetochore complex Fta4 of Sim4 subunit, or CENP-50-domain-containing protein [Phaeosphaeriaceae sp. PMI808]|nr:kinetochore complex Fta4 of Sim4 subunit, or CENP-50-domain-containing protein [Phaeosphaeriaceae sp. PMI808]